MNDFETELDRRLNAIRDEGLWRELARVESPQSSCIQIGGKKLLNFASNDYLGLANESALKEAAISAIERFGAGAGASRLVCGSLSPHAELEDALAAFKGTEAALVFSSGYATALGVISALLGKGDAIVIDRLAHACIVDAARLCGATLRVFRHNDLDHLERILREERPRATGTIGPIGPIPRILIVTESLFSMDGDLAPLRALVDLKDKYGAWLMVDEAHATGLYGPHRRGLAEHYGVSDRIEIQMGTLGKALGAYGGYIAGSRRLNDYLVNRARSFIFSTAPVPAAAAAASAGIRFVQSSAGEARCAKLWQRVAQLRSALGGRRSQGLSPSPPLEERAGERRPRSCRLPKVHGERNGLEIPLFGPGRNPSAIIPVPIGDEAKAVGVAASLRRRGLFIPAIRYPTVARGKARLRVTLTARHTTTEVESLVTALRDILPRCTVPHY